METESNQKMNFQEYVRWAFQENKNTMQNQKDEELQFQSLKQLDGDDMGQVIWLFRRSQSINKLKKQNTLFLDKLFILNHIINFLLTIIHHSKSTQEQITRLMKSIGIISTEEELQLVHIEDNELLSIVYERGLIQRMEEINQEDFKKLFLIIFELKEITQEQYKNIQELKILFNQNNNEVEFQPSSLKQHFGIVMVEINHVQENDFKKIEQDKQKESKLQIDIPQERKQQIQIRLCKVIYREQTQRKILLYDGTMVTGNIWIPDQDQYCIPLSVSLQTYVKYFNYRIEYLNEDQLFKKDILLSYSGPVNNNFDPNVSQAQSKLGIYGILNQNIEGKHHSYQGCFRDGLFDGIGNLYIGNYLQYTGEYRIGMKHGEGSELQNRDGDYLEGNYDCGKKNGLFKSKKLIEGQKWQVNHQEPQKLYKNGIEVQQQNQGYQFELKKKSNIGPSRFLLNFGEYGINNFQLQSLQPGRWLNSSIIDIVIRFAIMKRNINDFNTVFINCNQFQDIFGSLVTKDEGIQTEVFKQIIDSKKQQQTLRFVFYFNLDRGHFLSVVYENNKLYLIDSMKDKKAHLLHQMKKLLNYFNFLVEGDCNSYDCGMYTIYYTSQIIKNIHLSIPEMIEKKCFNVEQSRINYIRYLIANNILQFGIELLLI